MNKKVLIVIAVVLLLLGIGWYFMSPKKSSNTIGTQTANTNQPSSATNLKDLLSKGIAQSCTFSTDSSSGSVYVSSGKVRGSFDTTLNGQTTKSNMLIIDNTDYIWTEGQTTGFKMALDVYATPSTTESNDYVAPKNGFDPTANTNYKCTSWVVDSSQFTLPANVTFSTFAMPQGATQTAPNATGSTGTGSSQCSYCNALSGDDKTQCLTALKCN